MNKIFIETRYNGKIELSKKLIEEMPSKVMLAGTVQFVGFLDEIRKKLVAYGKEVYFFKSAHERYPGQILGCDGFKVKQDVDCFLYIGTGEFHPRALLVNDKPVFRYNPLSEKWDRFGKKELEEEKLKKKVSLVKFLSVDKVGIIVSLKEGQKELQGRVKVVKEKLEGEGKEVYLFMANEVREEELENFNFIEVWLNTACPRIADDSKEIVNLRDL